MERLLLIGAALCLIGGFGYTLRALAGGRIRPGRFNFAVLTGAFSLLTGFLYLRGKAEGSCPLNSFFDILVFLSWSVLLIYLLVGVAYRLSLLGAFTAPFALVFILAALVLPIDVSVVRRSGVQASVEFHAALSIIAYGAFGLACVAGAMYLTQEHQLKSHRASQLLFNLPPISDLSTAIARLLGLGFFLLTIAFAAGFLSGHAVHSMKFAASAAIWFVYGVIVLMERARRLAPRRLATLAIAVFGAALVTLPAIQHLSARP